MRKTSCYYLLFTIQITRTAEQITRRKPISEIGLNVEDSSKITLPVISLFNMMNPAMKKIPARMDAILFVL